MGFYTSTSQLESYREARSSNDGYEHGRMLRTSPSIRMPEVSSMSAIPQLSARRGRIV